MSADTRRVEVRLRAATDADWGMIRRWLAEPAVIRWWGPKATSEAEVMLAMGTTTAICRIIEVNEQPVGYGHALDAGLLGETLPLDVPAGTWDVDLFVASVAHRGRGVGTSALELIRDEIFTTTLATAVCILVAVGNERAVRAYEKAGFRWLTVVREATSAQNREPQWLMLAKRPGGSPRLTLL